MQEECPSETSATPLIGDGSPQCFNKNSLDFQTLIDQLHKIFAQDSVNVEQVKELMDAYRSDPKEWKKYAKFDRYR